MRRLLRIIIIKWLFFNNHRWYRFLLLFSQLYIIFILPFQTHSGCSFRMVHVYIVVALVFLIGLYLNSGVVEFINVWKRRHYLCSFVATPHNVQITLIDIFIPLFGFSFQFFEHFWSQIYRKDLFKFCLVRFLNGCLLLYELGDISGWGISWSFSTYLIYGLVKA